MTDDSANPNKSASGLKGTSKKPKKPRCSHSGCKAAPFLGADCSFCSGKFCARHRLPEMHECPQLTELRQSEKESNKSKVEAEATKQRKI